ncbi:BC1872 family protein [Paenibacillus xylanexedens]|uniref:Phage ABA sandwich domain-containing protein n=1 Tax=Paenibacillus xylanexedens TaxID=528191 RepID=A0ABS4RLP8_PAEXY|nr:hypothetical protein [Paenibacillus xylanexedens]MBP2243828.1 hypothetical protein [Paenibacillus xylanexedens]
MKQTALTRERVLNAEPGTELNIMVAEHIFKWRRIQGPAHDYDGAVEHGEVLIPPDMSDAHAYAMMPPRGSVELSYFINRNWSEDIYRAWMVIKQVEKEWAWEMKMHNTACEVDVRIGRKDYSSENVSEAICKAALLAVLDL